jgi:hypothetical protein
MGVVGIIIALVNFSRSRAMQFAISVVGWKFAGLTAYDTQRASRDGYMVVRGDVVMAKSAIMGALSLYLDFINMCCDAAQPVRQPQPSGGRSRHD